VGAHSECGVRTVLYAMVPVPRGQDVGFPTAGIPVTHLPLEGKPADAPPGSARVGRFGPRKYSPGVAAVEKALHDGSALEFPAELRILVVDDSTSCRRMLMRLMQNKAPGTVMDEAVDGQEAVDLVATKPPGHYHVIFMDNDMPRMTGEEAVVCLRERGVRTRIVMVTGTASLIDQTRFVKGGVDAVLVKPVRAADLLRQLQKHAAE
jgi:CheY-like chemotaxis protein